MMCPWRQADRPAWNIQIQIHVRQLVFEEYRPMPCQVEVRSEEPLHPRSVQLVILEMNSSDAGFHMRDHRADSCAGIRLESAQKILSTLTQEPAIYHICSKE